MKLILCLGIIFCSCTSTKKVGPAHGEQAETVVTNEQKIATSAAEMDFYNAGMDQLNKGLGAMANSTFEDFGKKYPTSSLRSISRIRMAQALFMQEKWSEGVSILRNVIQSGVGNQEISAEALFQISYGYEALGSDTQMLASLKDAETLKSFLPMPIAKIELPARIGMAYMKLGETEEGQKYFKLTNDQISKYRVQHERNSDVDFAKILKNLGQVQTSTITMDNYQMVLDAVGVAQKYAMQAMEFSNHWAAEARRGIQQNYLDIWNFCLSPPEIRSLDAGASRRSRQDLQVRWLSHLLQLIDFAYLEYGSLSVPVDSELEKFKVFLNDMEYRAKIIVYNSEELTPLTPESQMRNKIKKDLSVNPVKPTMKAIPDDEIPEQSGTDANKEDPNL